MQQDEKPKIFYLNYDSTRLISLNILHTLREPLMGFRGTRDKTFLSAGSGIGSKIATGSGFKYLRDKGLATKLCQDTGFRLSRGNGIRSEICSVYANCNSSPYCTANRNSRIDSTKYREIVPHTFKI